ncbi:DUF1540 domain-containing protein [Schnuerera sp. xch1]|uniref:DUF1540 domain-containing protein n=1 Tax=Schnuerera sp. xch1 TaxID=2874283 RepID=UPI001CC06B01|nr:DUF1540 domain-containing protein [Schnuerera sp. xch1]MBZ2174482.1 DUF1540 domain-containing protein [Schnuerera sp. xch1]
MRIEKTDDHIDGVKCVVNTCYYYESGDRCNAAKIEIQPRNATNTEETDCATFRPKNNNFRA